MPRVSGTRTIQMQSDPKAPIKAAPREAVPHVAEVPIADSLSPRARRPRAVTKHFHSQAGGGHGWHHGLPGLILTQRDSIPGSQPCPVPPSWADSPGTAPQWRQSLARLRRKPCRSFF